jgi:hypothetical protein
MRLRLYFSGTQLFVPVSAGAGSSRVSAVMPISAGHHAPDQHVPVLAVREGYLSSGSTQEGEGWFVFPLRGRVLTIPQVDSLDSRICPEIVNLRDVTPLAIDADTLATNSRGKAVARVDLYAGRMYRVEQGACWYWNAPSPRPAAHIAEWVIEWPETTVSLELRDWYGHQPVALPKLYPLANTDVIDVSILHLPATEMPPEPEPAHDPPPMSEAPHFGNYFVLLDGYGPEGRLRFAAPPNACDPLPNGCPPLIFSGGSPFNCMLATVTPPTGG